LWDLIEVCLLRARVSAISALLASLSSGMCHRIWPQKAFPWCIFRLQIGQSTFRLLKQVARRCTLQTSQGWPMAKGFVTITLKCVRSQVRFLLRANNPEVTRVSPCVKDPDHPHKVHYYGLINHPNNATNNKQFVTGGTICGASSTNQVTPSKRKVGCSICKQNMHHEKAFCGHIRWHMREERDANIAETLALRRHAEEVVLIAKKIKISHLNEVLQSDDVADE
nr:hypothetical protein [Tanacetum cinerariifolium]